MPGSTFPKRFRLDFFSNLFPGIRHSFPGRRHRTTGVLGEVWRSRPALKRHRKKQKKKLRFEASEFVTLRYELDTYFERPTTTNSKDFLWTYSFGFCIFSFLPYLRAVPKTRRFFETPKTVRLLIYSFSNPPLFFYRCRFRNPIRMRPHF